MRDHWENIYATKTLDEVSWTRPHLDSSLKIIDTLELSPVSAVIDVGSGASTLADDLLERGFNNITLLDISAAALDHTRARLGERADSIAFVNADIREAQLEQDRFDLWHDRAVFHFLTDEAERSDYVERATLSLRHGGHLIIATFADDGPPKCSGLEVCRYNEETLIQTFGTEFEPVGIFREQHRTPFDTVQSFLYSHFRRVS